jgi:hypothetical protein
MTPLRSGGWGWYGEGPNRFTAEATGLPYRVEVDAELRGGRYEATAIRVERKAGGPEVTGEGLRTVPVREIVTRGAAEVVSSLLANPAPDLFKRVNDDALRLVADVYRYGVAAGRPPTQHVAEHLFSGVRSTAARWVMRAREGGFLGPAQTGRPGEQPRKRRKGRKA